MARYVMIIDTDRCIGCNACIVACKLKNATPPGISWCKVIRQESGTFPKVTVANTPIQCMHCQNPPCVENCPTGSRVKTADGIVTTDQDKCTGCEECIQACPYDVQSVSEPGVVGKCDFCLDFVRDGKKPACVRVCPLHVREFGDLDDPDDIISKLIKERSIFRLHTEKGTEPSVYYLRDKD